MITSKQAGAVTTIVHDYSGDDNVGLLYLTSDLHIDSVYCNRTVEKHGLSKGRPTELYCDIRVMPLIHAPDLSGV